MDATERGQVNRDSARVYEEFFVPALFAQWPPQLLAAAAVASGHRVLDVGCGTGIAARAAVERIRPGGHIVGLDPNEGMLDVARALEGTVDWQQGVAEVLPFDNAAFDIVLCQHALMFFADRVAAVDEMRRVLAPGGRLAVATWADVTESPGYAAMLGLIQRLFGETAAEALRAPFSVGTVTRLRSILSPAFPQLEVEQREGKAEFESIAAWVHTEIRGWTLADLLDEEMEARLLTVATSELDRFTDRQGRVQFPAPALVAAASR